jgi:hypothetical protein
MIQKDPRPTPSNQRGLPGGDMEEFGDASNPTNIKTKEQRQEAIAWAHVFVTRFGDVGYWIPICPLCEFEHTHGGFAPFDPRLELSWLLSHCHQAPRKQWGLIEPGVYLLRLAPGPARFAPGAAHSRQAKATMDYLRSIGIETSNQTIPSTWPPSRWRWL